MYCPRCSGRKTIFKNGSGYSLVDLGGVSVECPMCLGVGKIDRQSVIKDIKKKTTRKKKDAIVKDKIEIKIESKDFSSDKEE